MAAPSVGRCPCAACTESVLLYVHQPCRHGRDHCPKCILRGACQPFARLQDVPEHLLTGGQTALLRQNKKNKPCRRLSQYLSHQKTWVRNHRAACEVSAFAGLAEFLHVVLWVAAACGSDEGSAQPKRA